MLPEKFSRRAFTLTEVIVIMTIIVIFASIVLPSLGGLNHSAKASSCLGNLRQIGMSVSKYVIKNRQALPPTSSRNSAENRRSIHDYLLLDRDLFNEEEDYTALQFAYHGKHARAAIFLCPAIGVEGDIPLESELDPVTPADNDAYTYASYGVNPVFEWDTIDNNGEQRRRNDFSGDLLLLADGRATGVFGPVLWPAQDGVFPERHRLSLNMLTLGGAAHVIKEEHYNDPDAYDKLPWKE